MGSKAQAGKPNIGGPILFTHFQRGDLRKDDMNIYEPMDTSPGLDCPLLKSLRLLRLLCLLCCSVTAATAWRIHS